MLGGIVAVVLHLGLPSAAREGKKREGRNQIGGLLSCSFYLWILTRIRMWPPRNAKPEFHPKYGNLCRVQAI